jgi:glycosyltransferase involved in cell wall biosynthesis
MPQIYQLPRAGVSLVAVFCREILIFLLALVVLVRHKEPRIQVIYRRHNLFNSERVLARLFGIPLVKEVNGIVAKELKVRLGKSVPDMALGIIDRIERFNMPRADRIIVVTPRLKEVLRAEYGVPENKIAVIENGANTELFKPGDAQGARRELNLSQSDNYICFVGSLARWQGLEYLINALPRVLQACPNTRLLVVGDGEMKTELVELARHLDLANKVIFTGRVSYPDVPTFINASDVCVVPKKPMGTGFSPLKLCEYMACGRPVVATRTDGFEILEENNAGLLVNPENSQEFGDAIINLLRNPELRKQMGENGREYVVENRSWQSVATRLAEVFRQSAVGHRPASRRG